MKSPFISTLSFYFLLIFFSCTTSANNEHNHFLHCLFDHESDNQYSSISNIVHTRANYSSYIFNLEFSIQNLRFESESTPKPEVIITPEHKSQIPPVILCAKQTGLEIRTRSGGHDYEGLSYVSQVPFVIIDMIKLNEVTVDVEEKTAWVESGATLGNLYSSIGQRSKVLGFPAGDCPTVGVGGQLSGGGIGLLARKYGTAADNIIDARIVDVTGRILDRESMGEDLFWAIRGGGGASFGVIVAWKVKLVDVPETVTVFTIDRTMEENATQLLHRWQYVAPELSKDLFIRIIIKRKGSTINLAFNSLFLGGKQALVALMQEKFPELGLVREECEEVRWIESVAYIAGNPIESWPQVLNSRTNAYRGYTKVKSDYVQTPIPQSGIEGVWRHLYEDEGTKALIQLVPYGGRMAEISKSAIPFPHRAGNLYEIFLMVYWDDDENQDADKYINWIRKLEHYMTPYVSTSPRGRYLNLRDLDLGTNNVQGETSYEQASMWGKAYFKDNFDRLVRVKTMVDPKNFFKNEQSIPPLHLRSPQ